MKTQLKLYQTYGPKDNNKTKELQRMANILLLFKKKRKQKFNASNP